METTVDLLRSEIKRVLVGQLAITIIISAGVFFYQSFAISTSTMFGGATAMILSWWLGVGTKKLNNSNGKEQTIHLVSLVLGFVQRMVIVLFLFWLGIGFFGLNPLALTASFCVAYIVYWIELYRMG